MLYNPQWPPGEAVQQLVLHLGLEVEAELVDDVARVDNVLRHLKFAFARLPKILASLLLQFGLFLPFCHHLGKHAEAGDARRHIVLVAVFRHQREQPCHHRHRSVEWHHIRVVADAGAGVLVGIVADVLSQFLAQYFQKCRLRPREEGLPDAAPLIEIMVVGYRFLVSVPKSFHGILMCF